MAKTTITQLRADHPASALDGSETLAIDQGGETRGATIEEIGDFAADYVGAGALLYEMPIDVDAVGEPVYIRTAGDSPTNPAGTGPADPSIVACLSFASRNALRLSMNERGGWVWPFVDLPTLPTEGFVIDWEIARLDTADTWSTVLFLGADFTGATVEGLMLEFGASAANLYMRPCVIATSLYARPGTRLSSPLPGFPSIPNTTCHQKGPTRMRIEFRRAVVAGPATRWSVRVQTISPVGTGYPYDAGCSSVSHATASLDGKSLAVPAIGLWIDAGGAGNDNVDTQRFRIFALP